jgi:hypothetical protein
VKREGSEMLVSGVEWGLVCVQGRTRASASCSSEKQVKKTPRGESLLRFVNR